MFGNVWHPPASNRAHSHCFTVDCLSRSLYRIYQMAPRLLCNAPSVGADLSTTAYILKLSIFQMSGRHVQFSRLRDMSTLGPRSINRGAAGCSWLGTQSTRLRLQDRLACDWAALATAAPHLRLQGPQHQLRLQCTSILWGLASGGGWGSINAVIKRRGFTRTSYSTHADVGKQEMGVALHSMHSSSHATSESSTHPHLSVASRWTSTGSEDLPSASFHDAHACFFTIHPLLSSMVRRYALSASFAASPFCFFPWCVLLQLSSTYNLCHYN